MIGLAFGGIMIGAFIVEFFNSLKYNANSKNKSIKEGNRTKTYHRWNGHDVDIVTGKKVRIQREGYDNFFVRDLRTDKIIRDVYEEERLKQFKLQKAIGKRKSILFANMERLEALWDNSSLYKSNVKPYYSQKKEYFYQDPLKTTILAHLKTGKLCFIGDLPFSYQDKIWAAIGIYNKEKGSRRGNLPRCYRDIFTGEVLDIVDEKEIEYLKADGVFDFSNFNFYKSDVLHNWDYTWLDTIMEICREEYKNKNVGSFHQSDWNLVLQNYKGGIKI